MVHIRHKVTKFFRRPEQMGVSQNGGAVSRLWAGLFPIKRRISYPAAYVFIFFPEKFDGMQLLSFLLPETFEDTTRVKIHPIFAHEKLIDSFRHQEPPPC